MLYCGIDYMLLIVLLLALSGVHFRFWWLTNQIDGYIIISKFLLLECIWKLYMEILYRKYLLSQFPGCKRTNIRGSTPESWSFLYTI